MATVRNLTEHTLDLRCIGRAVAPDEKVDVDDDVFDTYVWPSTVWDCSRDSKAEPRKTRKQTVKKSAAAADIEES